MLNPNGADIYSAGLTDFAELIYEIVVTKAPKGTNVTKDWEKVYKILPILHSLANVDYLEDDEANALYSCLVELLEIYDTTGYPTVNQPDPVITNQGPAGPVGPAGNDGADGVDGTDGVSIEFLGSFASAPLTPTLNQAYRDTVLLRTRGWFSMANNES
jgi:hypothetical protein